MTTLKEFVLHQLRETRREMLAAIEGLSEKDLTWMAGPEHGPIAWIVQRCCANVDFFIHRGITGEWCLEHEPRFRAWPLPGRRPDDVYPPPPELIDRWMRLLDASLQALESAPEQRVWKPWSSAPCATPPCAPE